MTSAQSSRTYDRLPMRYCTEEVRALMDEQDAAIEGWKQDAEAYRRQTGRYVDALRELHRAIDEDDGSDCDEARLQDALVQAREMAPYVPQPPDPEGF